MTYADEMKTGLKRALDQQERANALLRDFRETVDQLQAELILLGSVTNSNRRISGITASVEQVKLNQIKTELNLFNVGQHIKNWYDVL